MSPCLQRGENRETARALAQAVKEVKPESAGAALARCRDLAMQARGAGDLLNALLLRCKHDKTPTGFPPSAPLRTAALLMRPHPVPPRRLAPQVQLPGELQSALQEGMRAAGIPVPQSADEWDAALTALKSVWASKYNDRAYVSTRKVSVWGAAGVAQVQDRQQRLLRLHEPCQPPTESAVELKRAAPPPPTSHPPPPFCRSA